MLFSLMRATSMTSTDSKDQKPITWKDRIGDQRLDQHKLMIGKQIHHPCVLRRVPRPGRAQSSQKIRFEVLFRPCRWTACEPSGCPFVASNTPDTSLVASPGQARKALSGKRSTKPLRNSSGACVWNAKRLVKMSL